MATLYNRVHCSEEDLKEGYDESVENSTHCIVCTEPSKLFKFDVTYSTSTQDNSRVI